MIGLWGRGSVRAESERSAVDGRDQLAKASTWQSVSSARRWRLRGTCEEEEGPRLRQRPGCSRLCSGLGVAAVGPWQA